MNSSGVFWNDLKKEIKFFNSRDFDEISKFSIENLSSIKDFNESCVFIFSISIFLLWFIKFVPIVLAWSLNWNGSKINFISFNSTSKFLSNFRIFSVIWLLNLSVSIPKILRYDIEINIINIIVFFF